MRRLMIVVGVALLLHSGHALAGFIDSSGRDWLAPNWTRDLRWTDIASVCSVATGECNGALSLRDGRTYDLSGYSWATRDEVRQLFYEASGLPAGVLDDYYEHLPGSPEYASRFFAEYGYTYSQIDWAVMPGFTRTVEFGQTGFSAYMGFVFGDNIARDGRDALYSTFIFNLQSITTPDVTYAAYVYKPALAVTEPGTLGLFAAGALAIFASSRYRRHRR